MATERKWSDAVEQFRTVLNLTPSDVEARGLLDEAAVQFERAIALEPTSSQFREDLATCNTSEAPEA